MASGQIHDRATTWMAFPFGLVWAPGLGWEGALVAGLAFLLGGLWLSPDLDTHSNATRRWGPLRGLWWPYRRLVPHRSPLSHSPLLGSAGRLLYLGSLVALGAALQTLLGGSGLEQLNALAVHGWHGHRPLLLAGLIGVEASGWLHLVLDGDPVFRWPRKRRKLRRKRRRC